jgi:hypothetical protein
MADDLITTLTRFHREIVIPDIERIVKVEVQPLREELTSLRREMLSHFDAIYTRFDRLEDEYRLSPLP